MSILKDFRNTKKITLPGYEDSQVVIYDGILYGDAADVTALQSKADDMNAIAKALVRLIKEWNFTDAQGAPLPVTEENIKLLSIPAVAYIAEECHAFISEAKKK